VAVLATLGVPALAHATRTVSRQSFTFSGAVAGTLKGDCGGPMAGYGGSLTISGSLKGSPANEWILNVNTPLGGKKGGTFRDFKRGTNGLAPASIVLQGETSKSRYNWISISGSVTTTPTSGHLQVTFGPDVGAATGVVGKGTIHLRAIPIS
jgi:hypothetical protein